MVYPPQSPDGIVFESILTLHSVLKMFCTVLYI